MRRKLVVAGLCVVIVAAIAWRVGVRHVRPEVGPRSGHASDDIVRGHGRPSAAATPASVSGRVTHKSDGSGVGGALVSLARAELAAEMIHSDTPAIVVTTNASGAWTAPQVTPGDYVVAATAPGMLPATHARIVIASGEARTGVDLVLEAGGTVIRGTITDVGGGPIADARVTANQSSFHLGGDPDLVATTGVDGTYQLTLGDGSYTATATHDEYSPQEHDVELAGKPLVVDFVLTPGGVIRGQVIARDTGKPVPGAMVTASGKHYEGQRGVISAASDGAFTLHSLGPGAISITAAGRGYASASPTVVELGIGEQVDGINVLVDHAFTISGNVVKKAKPGEGIAGIQLGAFSMGTQQQASSVSPTDASGAFEIVGVRPASYLLFAFGDGTVPEVGKAVNVVDHDVTDVKIEMAAGVTLAGRVDPAASASIGLEMVGEVGIANMFEMFKSAIVHADSDPTGAFVLHNVPSGKFTVAAMTKEGRAGTLPIVVGDADQSGLVVSLEARASIAGRVIDTNGAPVGEMRVVARSLADKPKISFSMNEHSGDVTSADGAFRIVGLEAGKYQMGVEDPHDFASAIPHDKKAVEVELANAAEKTGVTLTIDARDGVIRGQVLGPDGKGAADSWVTAQGELSKDFKVSEGNDFGFQSHDPVLTNADGRFVIDHLRRGNYKLVAEGPRGASHAEAHTKTGNSVTLTLEALGTLTVRVRRQAAPVTTYDVSCRGPAGSINRNVEAADGTYGLEHLVPGPYDCGVSAKAGTAKGHVDVPAGPAQLEVSLLPWASLTGRVVSVLSGQAVPDIIVIASQAGAEGNGFADALLGRAPTTDTNGQFVVDSVAAGSGVVTLYPKANSFEEVTSHAYSAVEGQRVDLGTIKIAPPRTGDAGTLGLATTIDEKGLEVASIKAGGPADVAGVKVGDRIVAVDGHPIGVDLPILTVQQMLSSGNIGIGEVVQLGFAGGGSVTLTSVKW